MEHAEVREKYVERNIMEDMVTKNDYYYDDEFEKYKYVYIFFYSSNVA